MIGKLIQGKYRVEELRGAGGFASVYSATNVLIDRPVALKILHDNLVRSPVIAERFLREAKIACKNFHPTIVRVEDVGRTDEGAPFLVMELIEGRTLAKEVDLHGALSIERFLEIATLVLEGLAAAHDHGIIHRDVKPGNIFLVRPGFAAPMVRILDLGMAKDLGESIELTISGDIIGTPNYVAPEILLHPGESQWVPAVDVFSMGMVCFLMLTGRLPFDLNKIEQGYHALHSRLTFYQSVRELQGPSDFNPRVPAPIDSVVRHAMSLDPNNRYRDAGEMLAALEGAVARLGQEEPSAATLTEFDGEDGPTTEWSTAEVMAAMAQANDTVLTPSELDQTTPDPAPEEATVLLPDSNPTTPSQPPTEVRTPSGTLIEARDSSWPPLEAPTPSGPAMPSSPPIEALTPSGAPVLISDTTPAEEKRPIEPLWIIAGVLAVLVALAAIAVGLSLWYGPGNQPPLPIASARESSVINESPPSPAPASPLESPDAGQVQEEDATISPETPEAGPASEDGAIMSFEITEFEGLDAGEPELVKVRLVHLPRFARVTIDGKRLETAWIEGAEGSERRLMVKAPGYPIYGQKITLQREGVLDFAAMRQTTKVVLGDGSPAPVEPSAEPGALEVRTIPSAKVYLDGRLIGESPVIQNEVSAGPHTLYLINPPYTTKRYDLNIQPGQRMKLRHMFMPPEP
jgi:serine/threonine protein kinase